MFWCICNMFLVKKFKAILPKKTLQYILLLKNALIEFEKITINTLAYECVMNTQEKMMQVYNIFLFHMALKKQIS